MLHSRIVLTFLRSAILPLKFLFYWGSIFGIVSVSLIGQSLEGQMPALELPESQVMSNGRDVDQLAQAPQVKFLNGTWEGTYVCIQGLTNLRLEIKAQSPNDVDAVFNFSAHPSNPLVPSGSFRMKGTYTAFNSQNRPGLLYLQGTSWIQQPPGWGTVNLRGNIFFSEGKISGDVETPGCSKFELTAQSASRSVANTAPVNVSQAFTTDNSLEQLGLRRGMFYVRTDDPATLMSTYSNLPANITDTGGKLLDDPFRVTQPLSIATYRIVSREFLFLQKTLKHEIRNVRSGAWNRLTIKILDIQEIPAGSSLVPSVCQLNQKPNPNILALVPRRNYRPSGQWHTNFVQVWRINRGLQRLELIPSNGVRCEIIDPGH
jgi:hypothetical protein